MENLHQPKLQFQESGNASIINYNVPEPTSYFGNYYIEINVKDFFSGKGQDWRTIFKDFNALPFQGRLDLLSKLPTVDKIAACIQAILDDGYTYKKLSAASTADIFKIDTTTSQAYLNLIANCIYLPQNFDGLKKIRQIIITESQQVKDSRNTLMQTAAQDVEILAPGSNVQSSSQVNSSKSVTYFHYQKILNLNYTTIAQKILQGNFFVIYKTFSDQYNYRYLPVPEQISPKIFVIEKYRLSSFLGNYGAGRTIKTFSLLPGEKTKMSVKTFKKTTVTSKLSSSILDSYSQESADDFESTLNNETSTKIGSQDKLSFNIQAQGGLDLGIGTIGGNAGSSGEESSQREDMAKSVNEAVTKNSQKASSQRDISIETSFEQSVETGEEVSIERKIKNINVSRTLNFVFRQMNQEYLTLLHLIDANVGYTSGLPGSFKQGSIPNLNSFFQDILQNQLASTKIQERIVDHLCLIVNYAGREIQFLEQENYDFAHPLYPDDPNRRIKGNYIKVKNGLVDTYFNEASQLRKEIPGIIISADLNVMRTEGVFAEAFLGQGDGLDKYSLGLQDETIRSKKVANDLQMKEAEKIELANNIIANNEGEKAKLFEQVYPCCPDVICDCKSKTNNNGESNNS